MSELKESVNQLQGLERGFNPAPLSQAVQQITQGPSNEPDSAPSLGAGSSNSAPIAEDNKD